MGRGSLTFKRFCDFTGFCDTYLPIDKYPLGCDFDPEDTDFLKLGLRFVGLVSKFSVFFK